MFENFCLIEGENKITGYRWDIKDPTHVMCVIHGIGEHAGRYDRVAGILNEAGVEVISMDLLGHGLSAGKRGHTAPRNLVLDNVTEMLRYAKKEFPDIPITLYGHSMGGNICFDYLLRGEANSLPDKYIISAPWLKLVRSVPKPLIATLKALSRIAPSLAINSGCKPKDLGNMKNVAGYATDPQVHPYITLKCAVEGNDVAEAICSGTHENNHGADGKPLLLMHGSEDRICSVEGSRIVADQRKNDPNFTYIEWPGYYHEIHNGGAEATGEKVIETIRDFVKE